MKFLIDECLHTSLVAVATARGHAADHVSLSGFSGAKDRELMGPILDSGSLFVTNNARDFRRLYAQRGPHPGLLVLIPNVTPALQRTLFDAGLDDLETSAGLDNQVMEIRIMHGELEINRFVLKPKADKPQI